jgi:hypothetical protein
MHVLSHCSLFQSLPLCVWSLKALRWVTKTGLICTCHFVFEAQKHYDDWQKLASFATV